MLNSISNRFMLKKQCILAILLPTMIFSLPLHAEDFVVENNSKISADISARELTRIAVEGDRITMVRGTEGAYQVSNDNNQGAIFIKPILASLIHNTCSIHQNEHKTACADDCHKPCAQAKTLKPFYLFISTEQGRHYVLNLKPFYNQQADILNLKPKDLEHTEAKAWEKSENYTLTLVHLVDTVLHQKTPPGYTHIELKKPKAFTFGKDFNLELKEQYIGAHLSVDIYQITNDYQELQTLAEKDLYQMGDRAIYLQETHIASHQTVQLIKVTSHV